MNVLAWWRRRAPGKTERRLVLVVLLTAIVPLAAALFLANSLFAQASALWFNPDVGRSLDEGLDAYKEYATALKDDMRHQTDAIASDSALTEAAAKGDKAAVAARLSVLLPRHADLVSLAVENADGERLAEKDRGRVVDDSTERSLDVRRPLGDAGDDTTPTLVAVYATDRKHLDTLQAYSDVVQKYHTIETSRSQLYNSYFYAFAALLGIVLPVTVVIGGLLARGVTRRIHRLALAIDLVAEGDLSVRVPVTGSDELTELARVFNRMLGEMAQSRARIEYLQRIGAWQEMAQRLAHEIKNPLTPIQLAVQECHRKYVGDDPRFRSLLDLTCEIVEEEVGTLRRLVGNFSSFARLPHAELKEASVREFLRECSDHLGQLEDWTLGEDSPDAEPIARDNVTISWDLPKGELLAAIDRQMLRRVLINLIRNAVQAVRGPAGTGKGRVTVSASASAANVAYLTGGSGATGEGDVSIHVDDDGPGIDEGTLARIFEPYFTTKTDGTGLGLAIVKKIIVEHGGSIEAARSKTLGGARFTIHLPGPRAIPIPRDSRELAALTRARDGMHELPS